MTIVIRDASPADGPIIAEFNSRLREETEGKPLDPEVIGPGVAAMLADPLKGRYWVAETEGEIVGQIMVTYEWSDWRNGTWWWLQSVYVREDHRQSGIFKALYRYIEALARGEDSVVGIRLYVEKDNGRAQSIYDGLGFRDTGYQMQQKVF
ncbi:MAG: GNAT family N-acetyltransferase [Woeseiaceae bacterium]|nr:GNAT family N-acetyltransferase [Woeseiaceae bacterium]